MEREWRLRQENVLPLETAFNEGRFYGLALKGSRRLTRVQRIGLFLIGIVALGTGLTISAEIQFFPSVGPSLKSIYSALPDISVVFLPVLLLELALGARLCWVALKPAPRLPRQK